MANSTIINGESYDDRTVEVEDKGGNDSKVPALMQKIAALEQEKTELVHENEVINQRMKKLKGEIEASESEKEKLKSDTKALDSIALVFSLDIQQYKLITEIQRREMRGPLGAARGTYPSSNWNAQMGNRGSGIQPRKPIELDLTDCSRLVQVQGLENLNSLQYVLMAGCNNLEISTPKSFFQRRRFIK